jgi:tripartite-type tricarboxylate transporter receptor subunit TctC
LRTIELNSTRSAILVRLFFCAMALPLTLEAAETAYPLRPVRLIVPFAPGGSVDLMARMIAGRLSEQLGQTVIIDNRPGAGGAIGAELGARSAPDGYSLLIGSSSTLVINPAMTRKLAYDTLKDFAPIALLVRLPLVIVTHPSIPARNTRELVALAKRNPGKLSFGSIGIGTANHLVGELFAHAAGVNMVHVPYKGGGAAALALLSGEIEVQVSAPNTMLPFVRNGRIRPIATTGIRRSIVLPDVETLVEAGYKELGITGWFCLVAPAGLPAAIVERWNSELRRAFQSADIRNALLAEGMEPDVSSAEALDALMRAELPRWARAVALAGVKPE